MRISGLASGMDTENMIKDLMTAERIPVDRVYQKKIQAEWQRDAYREVNNKLLRLRNLAFDLSLQGAYQTRAAVSSHDHLIAVEASGSSSEGTFYLRTLQLAKTAQFSTESGDVAASFAAYMDGLAEGQTVSLKMKGQNDWETIELSPEDTLEGFLQKINENKELGLQAYYDAFTDQIAISSKITGEDAQIMVGYGDENGRDFWQEFLGADFHGSEELSLARGENAILEINGLETQRTANTFDLNGTTVTLNEESDTLVRITVEYDVDAVAGKIKELVELYNDITGELNLAIREEVYRDYPPLTPQQREEMSEREIELWEERAKSGLLRSDSLISSTLSEIRQALGSAVQGLEGGLTHLSQVGISTGAWFEYGKLHVNEEKLKETLRDDSAAVMALFTNNGEAKSQGLARRLATVLDGRMERIASTAGKATIPYDQSYLGRQIRDYESEISQLEERLQRIEQSYWDKFITMERVLSQLHSQGDWLYQQMLAMQG